MDKYSHQYRLKQIWKKKAVSYKYHYNLMKLYISFCQWSDLIDMF